MPEDSNAAQLIYDVKNHVDWRVRQKAIEQLSHYHTTEVMEAIIYALYDNSPHVVQTAAYGLVPYGSAALPGLLDALKSDAEIAARWIILHVLGKIKDPSVIPTAIGYLSDENIGLQATAVGVCTQIPDERAIDPLIKLLEKTPEEMKYSIAEALGAIGSPKVIPALIPLLYSDEQVTRRFAAKALGKIGTEAALQALLDASHSANGEARYNTAEGLELLSDERAFERLVELTQDEYPLTRAMAAKSLARFDGVRAQPHLLKLLDDPDSTVQNSLDSALGLLSSLDVVPIMMARYRNNLMHRGDGLYHFAIKHWDNANRGETVVYDALDALQGDDENLRITATWLLYAYTSKLRDHLIEWQTEGKAREAFPETELQSQVISVLVDLLTDPNDDVRLSAMEPIIRVGDRRASANLIQCLASDNELIVQQAAHCLETIRDPETLQPLLKALNTDNEITRSRIMSALAAIGGDDALNVLANLLTHPDPKTRRDAASDLGYSGDNRAVRILIERLGEELDQDVRERIIFSLGELGDKQATQSIIDVLSNAAQNPRLHSQAILALRRIRDEAALPALYHEVNTGKAWQTRATATSAIAAIGTPYEAANRLFELLGHDHETVRTTAAKDLGYLGARTEDLVLRDYIVNKLIQHLQDDGAGYHAAPTVAHMAAKSLYYVGTPEANAALRTWELKQGNDQEETQ